MIENFQITKYNFQSKQINNNIIR